MSKALKDLRERRTALALETRNLLEQNPGATWNKDHQSKYDENIAEIERIEGEIDRHQKMNDIDADRQLEEMNNSGKGGRKSELLLPGDAGFEDAVDERSIFAAWARRGYEGLGQNQRAAYQQSMRNTMSTTTGSEGGYTVQTEVAKSFQDALKLFGGVRLVANVFTTDQGNPMNYPTSDGTAEEGEQIAENTTATAADPTFGTVGLNVYKYSSKVVAVPFELLQDSTLNIEQIVTGRLQQRIARIQNRKFTLGTGTSEPRGVVTAAAAGKVGTTGQTLTVIYDDLVDLQHSVDPAYRALGCEFMFNDTTLKVIRKIKDTQGRPIFVPGYEVGTPGGVPDSLLGTNININQHMADMAANAKSILYGYFKAYQIRDVMAYTLFRFTDSAYAKLGQVGFLAWARCGGNYTDVGKSLSYYQNSAT